MKRKWTEMEMTTWETVVIIGIIAGWLAYVSTSDKFDDFK